MKAYELLYFVAPNTDDDARAGVMTRIETIVKDAKGEIDNVDDWGRKKLAYEIHRLKSLRIVIAGQADADYTLIDFHADSDSIAELDRVLRINDAVIRHMVVAREDRD